MHRRPFSVSALLASFLFIALPLASQETVSPCGPRSEKYRIIDHKGEHPTPKPPSDKALVYVFGEGHRIIAVNGKWVAYGARGRYAYFEAEPGLLKFCVEPASEVDSPLFLTVEGGKTYYIRDKYGGNTFIPPPLKAYHWGLFQLEDSEGERLLAKSKFITMEARK